MIKKILIGFLVMLYGFEFGKYVHQGNSFNFFLSLDEVPLYLSMLLITICLILLYFTKRP